MNSYLLGLLTAVVFFCCLMLFFWMGTRYAQKKPPDKVIEDETIRKQRKLHEDFLKTIQYNENIARQRKKVT